MQSGSIDLAADGINDYDLEDNDGYGQEAGPSAPGSLSKNSSTANLPGGGKSRNARVRGVGTEMQNYGKGFESSLGVNTAMKRHQRARSTIHGSVKTYGASTVQASAPFHSSGPRFTMSPKQCK